MPLRWTILGMVFVLHGAPLSAQGSLGTAFTYQGRLAASGVPATGSHDFEFRVFDAPTAGNQVGITIGLGSVQVNGGLFRATLDFGNSPNPFSGQARWL